MPESLRLSLGLAVIVAAVVGVARRGDVRLVLFLAALALGGLAGDITPVLRTFLSTLSNEQFVIPICTAMGFAQVLRHSGCDQHLVHLLVRPLQSVRVLLIPGAVCVGFVVNISVISQASTAVAAGTVLVPLLRSAGFTPVTVGAALLLGSSLGGELLNPGAPEINTVARHVQVDPAECVPRNGTLLVVQLAVATAVFWAISARAEAKAGPPAEPAADAAPVSAFRINLFKAAVPLVPLVLLMIVGPPFNLVQVPEHWLVERAPEPKPDGEAPKAVAAAPTPARGQAVGTRLIGVSMLIGAALAALSAPRTAHRAAEVFFEGAGLALTRIIAVIVIAQCFGTGVKQLALDEPIRDLIRAHRELVWPLAGGLTLAFAALCGSGMAATQSLYSVYVTSDMSKETMLQVGSVTGVSAAAGRTMSPVAAVVFTCAQLSDAPPLAIARRVAGPLLVATAVMVAFAWYRG